ncbi:MAG TPA: Ig-like domain-containing protein [Longimicrobium sp.]|nr:Ig-like domain-containing protein [Longimicrobium sp.]
MRLSRFAASALVALAACSDSTGSGKGGPPARLDIVSGDLQPQAVAGAELAQPLVVKVLDAKGKPVEQQVVSWVVTAGGGHVFAGTSLTDANGEARERWTLGTVAGDTQRVEARAVNPTTGQALVFGQFRAFAVPGAAAQFVAEGAINAAAGDVVPAVTVRLADANGNGIAGAQVTWSVVTGTGTVSAAQTTTDAAGRASVQWSLGMEVGTQTVRATTGSLAPVQISTLAGTPAGSIQVVSGNEQTGTAGQPLAQPVVLAYRRTDGRYVAGATLHVSQPPTSGALSASSVVTGAQGTAQLTWTLGTVAGRHHFAATPAAPAFSQADVYANVTPGAPVLTVTGRPGPLVGVARNYSVTVRVADAYGNPWSGLAVTGTVEAGGGASGTATTDFDGRAIVDWKSGGEAEVTQRLRIDAGPTTATVTSLTRWIWFVLTQAPAANSVVTGNFVAEGDVYPENITLNPSFLKPAFYVTVDGRTQQIGHLAGHTGFYGTFDMSGLAPGAKVAVFRAVDPQGHESVQQIPFTYQP